jgi:signal transduction histidine kinase/CheY-like chemotaxis protein/HPt (histidine-containing phosphotransfer) domain-containing protein/HAMP domain-containing protein
VVLALALALFGVTILQLRTAEDRSDAERGRVTSFRLADGMRQSSNDLTRMVRLYVTTGEARYRDYYERILAIRRGTAPRPRSYDSSFWDRVLADGYAGVRVGPPVSLPELMRRARFSPEEFALLDASLRASDRLARLELETMDAVAARIARGTGGRYLLDVAPAYERLVDPAYHREKRSIMAAIERFVRVVDLRTSQRAGLLQDRTDRLLIAQSVVLAALGLMLVLLLTYATRSVVRPLERLTELTRRIRGGDWTAHAGREGVREIRGLADDFEEMTQAVQRELRGRERVEREALEAGRRLQTIADSVPGSVFHFHVDRDSALSVRFASRDSSVHGVGADAGVDFPAVARAVLAEDRGGWLDSLVAAARAGGTWEREYRIHGPDGGVAWVHGHALVRRGEDGSADLYGYVNDITEQKALEADLLRAREDAEGADRAKSAFLAMMSHELRTPLVAVTGTLEVLALGELERRQRERVDVAARAARALLGVIGDVLDFSKIEAGHLELQPLPSSLPRAVREIVDVHGHSAARKGLTLEAAVGDGLAPAHEVDAVRLRQVLGNLVGNAIKFTDEGGVRVVVGPDEGGHDAGTSPAGARATPGGPPPAPGAAGAVAGPGPAGGSTPRTQRVRILVEDTGIGVSPEDQARLFAPFTQASTDAARRSDGTGLGLVISRQLVAAMGGTLRMQSAPGAGTTMRIELELPVAAREAADGAGAAPDDPAAVPRRPRPTREAAIAEGGLVLLVEDHPVNRAVLAAQIEAAGVVVDVAADAREAEERVAGRSYGLVFTDLQLPGTDGYALATRLRVLEAELGRPPTPILALTASAVRGEAERCRAAGMDGLVTKPTTIAVLSATLRRWLPGLDWPAAPGGGPAGAASRDPEAVADGGPAGAASPDPDPVADGGPGGAPRAARAPGALDPSALDELTDGDPELGRQVLEDYVGSLGEDLAALRAARAARDADAAGRVAHRMGSAARMVGATGVARAAEALEAAAGEPAPGWDGLVDDAVRAADAVVAARATA